MEPENIDWDNIDSTFTQDDMYEDFDAPRWVDLSALDQLPDVEAWFCTSGCKHPKTAEDFLKPTTTTNSKAKLLRFVTISEILPFRDRSRGEKSSAAESSCAKSCEKSRRLSCSGNFHEDIENKNPNFSASNPNGRTNKPRKPPLLKPKKENPKQLNGSMECPVRSDRKAKLKSTFSAQNLLGGREILRQISGLCSELKKLARKGSTRKAATEKAPSGVSEELKETLLHRERVPFRVVNEGTTLNNGT